MEQLEEDPLKRWRLNQLEDIKQLERWRLNQLEDIKHRAEQIIQLSGNKTLGDEIITGFELLKLLMESQCVCERYRFMKRLQAMKGEKIK